MLYQSFTSTLSQSGRKSLSAPRILLVEDHADTASAFARILKMSGYEVTVAQSYDEAIKTDPNVFDLLISDIGLPDGDGCKLLRVMNQKGFRGKAIAVTAYGQTQDVARCKEAGYDSHVLKPVTVETLRSVIADVLSHS